MQSKRASGEAPIEQLMRHYGTHLQLGTGDFKIFDDHRNTIPLTSTQDAADLLL